MSDLFVCGDHAAAEEAAEAFVMRRMTVSEHERYEEHLLICERCQDAVRDFDAFLSAARGALGGPVKKRHQTSKLRAKTASC